MITLQLIWRFTLLLVHSSQQTRSPWGQVLGGRAGQLCRALSTRGTHSRTDLAWVQMCNKLWVCCSPSSLATALRMSDQVAQKRNLQVKCSETSQRTSCCGGEVLNHVRFFHPQANVSKTLQITISLSRITQPNLCFLYKDSYTWNTWKITCAESIWKWTVGLVNVRNYHFLQSTSTWCLTPWLDVSNAAQNLSSYPCLQTA